MLYTLSIRAPGILFMLLSFSFSVAFDPFVTPRTVAHQAPLSVRFPRQEHWSGSPFPYQGDLSDPGIEPASPALGGGFFTAEAPGKSMVIKIAL